MGFFTRKIKNNEEEQRSYLSACLNTANASLPYGNVFAGGGVNSLCIAAFYRCTELIASTLAQLPIKVKLYDKEHTSEADGHPLQAVFSDKTNTLSMYHMVKNVVRDVITKGNGFIYVYRNGDGSVQRLRYLEPNDVSIYYDKIKDVLYYTAPAIFLNRRIEPVNMLHFKMFSYDGVNGIGVSKYMAKTLALSKNLDDALTKFYENGMNYNGVLSAKQLVNEKQLEQIKQAWNNTYNHGGIVVLPSSLDFQPIQGKQTETQATREANAVEICMWLGVSPILIGILSKTSGYSFEQARIEFLTNTIMGWVRMMEEEMNRKLLRPSETNIYIDLDETYMLRADKRTLKDYYTGLISSGILCINEARKELGYNAVDGGDRHILPYTDIQQNTINQDKNDIS